MPDGQLHSGPELHEIEDREIAAAVRMQEDVGLAAVTDGEFRRSFWHYDFLDGLGGLDLEYRPDTSGVAFGGSVSIKPFHATITDTISFPDDHPMLGHFRYLASITNATPKISIPGPSACHFRTAAADIGPEQYGDLDVLLADIFFAYLCDEDQREAKRAEGFDPDHLITAYADTLERAIRNRPDDITIAMHMCRGNFRSTHVATGGYDPAVDAIFNRTSVDVYFMEYDTDRAGGIEPLSLLPKGDDRVMPGFITTKTPALEPIDDLKRRFDEASAYADLDQLGIAPRCGFASTEEGNVITQDDQRAKLELVVATADAIWGGVF